MKNKKKWLMLGGVALVVMTVGLAISLNSGDMFKGSLAERRFNSEREKPSNLRESISILRECEDKFTVGSYTIKESSGKKIFCKDGGKNLLDLSGIYTDSLFFDVTRLKFKSEELKLENDSYSLRNADILPKEQGRLNIGPIKEGDVTKGERLGNDSLRDDKILHKNKLSDEPIIKVNELKEDNLNDVKISPISENKLDESITEENVTENVLKVESVGRDIKSVDMSNVQNVQKPDELGENASVVNLQKSSLKSAIPLAHADGEKKLLCELDPDGNTCKLSMKDIDHINSNTTYDFVITGYQGEKMSTSVVEKTLLENIKVKSDLHDINICHGEVPKDMDVDKFKKIKEQNKDLLYEVFLFNDEDSLCSDYDRDGVVNIYDNCWKIANADQKDTDGNGRGDMCPFVKVFELRGRTLRVSRMGGMVPPKIQIEQKGVLISVSVDKKLSDKLSRDEDSKNLKFDLSDVKDQKITLHFKLLDFDVSSDSKSSTENKNGLPELNCNLSSGLGSCEIDISKLKSDKYIMKFVLPKTSGNNRKTLLIEDEIVEVIKKTTEKPTGDKNTTNTSSNTSTSSSSTSTNTSGSSSTSSSSTNTNTSSNTSTSSSSTKPSTVPCVVGDKTFYLAGGPNSNYCKDLQTLVNKEGKQEVFKSDLAPETPQARYTTALAVLRILRENGGDIRTKNLTVNWYNKFMDANRIKNMSVQELTDFKTAHATGVLKGRINPKNRNEITLAPLQEVSYIELLSMFKQSVTESLGIKMNINEANLPTFVVVEYKKNPDWKWIAEAYSFGVEFNLISKNEFNKETLFEEAKREDMVRFLARFQTAVKQNPSLIKK